MAIITDLEDNNPQQKRKTSQPPPSSSPDDISDGPHDEILKPILANNPPIRSIEAVIDFLGRKTDLFRDASVDRKISSVVSAVKRDVEVRKKKAEQSEVKREREPEKRLKEAEEVKRSSEGVKEEKASGSCIVGAPVPNKENGLDCEKYSWTQTFLEVTINIPVPHGTKSKFVVCDIKKNHVKIGLKGDPPVVDGELFESVKVDDCFWSIEDQKVVTVVLAKQKKMQWWKYLVKGEPEIDIKEPATTSLSELDLETQRTVEKIMFEQRQKSMCPPATDQMPNEEMMKKVMAERPGVDFPRAKIG